MPWAIPCLFIPWDGSGTGHSPLLLPLPGKQGGAEPWLLLLRDSLEPITSRAAGVREGGMLRALCRSTPGLALSWDCHISLPIGADARAL